MKKQMVAGLMLALVTALAGCGGGSSDSGPSGGGTPPPASAGEFGKVAGPMDAIQTPVSTQIMAPLTGTTAGTPLQALLICADRIVVNDVIDVIDSVAIAVQSTSPTALTSALTADNLQEQLQNTVVDLNGMLSAMRGDIAGCTRNALPTGSNPLAGTPLAAVGAQLAPVLDQIFDAVAGSGTSPRPDLPLATLVSLYGQLNFAVQSAFAQLPPEVTAAPILGDAIGAVRNALNQVTPVVSAAATNNTVAAQAAIVTAMNSVLKNLLLDVVPLRDIESQAGRSGVLSTPLAAGIDTVTSQFNGIKLDTLQPQAVMAAITSALGPVLSPIQNSVLGSIAGPLFVALDSVTTPGANPLGPVTAALQGFIGGSPTPLSFVTSTIQQVIGVGGTCPTAGTPLAVLCTLLPGLPI